MAVLVFPSLDSLQLAIASGAVPEAVCQAPARGGVGPEGTAIVQPSARLARAAVKELEQLGVRFVRSAGVPLDVEAATWLQLLPVRRASAPPEFGDKTTILFELADESQLPELVGEMLRLGNDRQSFRYVADGKHCRALLRVVGPPYYSLLRAVEGTSEHNAPRAYVSHGNRVWIQVGYEHPLAERLQPAANQMLLVGPPHRWTYLTEAKFRDVYEVLEFALPRESVAWQEAPFDARLRVPLRLAAGASTDAAELWVLEQDAVEQLDNLVTAADDRLIARLAFAVSQQDGKEIVVLRVRPSKEAPPVLVLRGVAYRAYLKLANLFLPVGRRLHPPLRRDAVAKLLAADRKQIFWLAPAEGNEFAPQSIPDDAFRPLSDWVEYVLDREGAALDAWIASHRFEFEPYECPGGDAPARKPVKERVPRERGEARAVEAAALEKNSEKTGATKKQKQAQSADEPLQFETPLPVVVGELEQQLRDLEAQFAALESPPDAEERRPLWRSLARTNAALGRRREATVCWSNAIWENPDPPASELQAWLEDEERGGEFKLSKGGFSSWLAKGASHSVNTGALAAFLAWSVQRESPPAELMQNLGAAGALLERLEANLPIRAAWMAWQALARLSGGDVLALAKARDRALERLFQHGLRPEFDLPSFLRTAGHADTERFRLVRERIADLRERAHRWISSSPAAEGETAAYVDLMFAYALARLGETASANELQVRAELALRYTNDEIHRWLCEAFMHRIRAANEGRTGGEPLPAPLLASLKGMEASQSYKIEKLRSESRIVEPFEKFDPYRRHLEKHGDDLGRQLVGLIDLTDREHLAAESRSLLAACRKRGQPQETARVLSVVLQLAPRLGEAFAREVLAFVPESLATPLELAERAVLLERGLILAANFDRGEYVQAFVQQFRDMLTGAGRREAAAAFDSLVAHCFRSLRKLGMRDALDGVFRELTDMLRRDAKGSSAAQTSWFRAEADQMEGDLSRSKDLMQIGKVLLHAADGWFYYGQAENARELLDDVRHVVLKGKLPEFTRMKLAAAYLGAFTQAPPEYALQAVEEIFARLKRPESRYSATMAYFAVLELNVIEAAVLTLVGDGFQINPQGRRWLDEDEFLVRRRIHRDVREAMAHGPAAS